MDLIKKHKVEAVLVGLLILFYFGSRLLNLTLQPIFADEAIYIRWAQLMRAEPSLRFISLTDGKPPLYMWVLIPFFKVIKDPLFAGRFLSVLSGFVTLIGVFLIGIRFFNKRIAFWAMLLIVVTPYILFFDRMALVDSMLSAFSIWSLLVAILLIKYKRIDLAMVLGYLLGGGMLTKPPGFFNILVLPITAILIEWKSKFREKEVLKIFGLWSITIVITLGIYNILRLGPAFNSLNSRNQDYVFSPLFILTRPWDPFLPHLFNLTDWAVKLLTIPISVFIILGSIMSFINKNRYGMIIFLWAISPMLVEMALLKTFTARYLLFSMPPLLLMAAYGLDEIIIKVKYRRFLKYIIVILIIISLPLVVDYFLLFNQINAPLPDNEKRGYFQDWTAGYGLKEIAQFLMNESNKELVVVGTAGSFGTLPDGLEIYLDKHSHIASKDRQVIVIGTTGTISAQLRQAATEHPTYYIHNGALDEVNPFNTELVKAYDKPVGPVLGPQTLRLYRVFPQSTVSGILRK